jgi:hypothetical protein
MIWVTTKVWPWLKRNWKWVIFPIGLLSLLLGVQVVASSLRDFAEPPEGLDEKAREALRKLRTQELEHDRKVAELEQEHKERLQELSDDQQSELEELQDKPIKEIVSWFDNLS